MNSELSVTDKGVEATKAMMVLGLSEADLNRATLQFLANIGLRNLGNDALGIVSVFWEVMQRSIQKLSVGEPPKAAAKIVTPADIAGGLAFVMVTIWHWDRENYEIAGSFIADKIDATILTRWTGRIEYGHLVDFLEKDPLTNAMKVADIIATDLRAHDIRAFGLVW